MNDLTFYDDQDGDAWAVDDRGRLWMAESPRFIWEGPATRDLADVEARYGPLTEMDQPVNLDGLLDLMATIDGPR